MTNKNIQLQGGMETLVQSFLYDKDVPLHAAIEYGRQVLSIKKLPSGLYCVRSSGSLSENSFTATHVVVTVPLPALASITFDPPLSESLQSAINDIHYVKAVKIFLQTRSPFWLKHGVDGMVISDLTSE